MALAAAGQNGSTMKSKPKKYSIPGGEPESGSYRPGEPVPIIDPDGYLVRIEFPNPLKVGKVYQINLEYSRVKPPTFLQYMLGSIQWPTVIVSAVVCYILMLVVLNFILPK